MSKVWVLGLLIFMAGCNSSGTWYGELEHTSSIPNGRPFNTRQETSADVVWTGLRTTYGAWYIDAAIGADLSGELQGRNPYGRMVIGKEIKTWGIIPATTR